LIVPREKKVLESVSFHSKIILNKVFNKKLDSESQELFNNKLERLHEHAERLAGENRNPIDVDNEPHTSMIWSYPIKPYSTTNSVNLINVTLQRTLHNIVEGCLTSQFYSAEKKKNVIGAEVFNAVLNLSRGNEIW
jgi:hypothetical protein